MDTHGYYIDNRALRGLYLSMHLPMLWQPIIVALTGTRVFRYDFLNHDCIDRGDTFRSTLRRIGEVRSILPKGVNVMALTATATKTL